MYANAKCYFDIMLDEIKILDPDAKPIYVNTDGAVLELSEDFDLSLLKIGMFPGMWKIEIPGKILSFNGIAKNVSVSKCSILQF